MKPVPPVMPVSPVRPALKRGNREPYHGSHVTLQVISLRDYNFKCQVLEEVKSESKSTDL